MPNSSYGQSENDSTFNGIDYYAGRIAKGFGGGVEHQITDKEQGYSFSSTCPSVYGSIGNRLALQLSNMTNWVRYDDDLSHYDKNVFQRVGMQANYRLARGVWLSGGGSFERRKLANSDAVYYKDEENRSSFRGLYLSQAGQTHLTPDQLAFAYYAVPQSIFLHNDRPFRILSPKQSMVDISGDTRSMEYSVRYDTTRSEFSTIEDSDSGSGQNLNIELMHTFNRCVSFGLDLLSSQSTFRSGESGIGYDGIRYEYHGRSRRKSFALAPRIEILGSKHILHRLGGQYDSSSLDDSMTRDLIGPKESWEMIDKSWNLDYSIHYLKNPSLPSLEAFLADQNNVFGNRLPAKGLHWIGRTLTGLSKGKANSLTPIGPNTQHEGKARFYDFSTIAIYGLSNWFEAGWKVSYRLTRAESADPYAIPPSSTNKQTEWSNSLVLNFANYRYEDRFKDRFGWEQIREFDRLYGPLLLEGMIKGTVAIQYANYKIDWQHSDSYRRHNWQAEAQIRLGILNNLEMNLLGYLKKERASYYDWPTFKQLNVSFIWQPWQTIRFQISRNASTNDTPRTTGREGDIWTFKMISLF
jgi:hypothetical protein